MKRSARIWLYEALILIFMIAVTVFIFQTDNKTFRIAGYIILGIGVLLILLIAVRQQKLALEAKEKGDNEEKAKSTPELTDRERRVLRTKFLVLTAIILLMMGGVFLLYIKTASPLIKAICLVSLPVLVILWFVLVSLIRNNRI